MKQWMSLLLAAFLLAGCQAKPAASASDKKVAMLESEILILRQSVERQIEETRALKSEVEALRSSLAGIQTTAEAVQDLKIRVSDIEDSGFLK